MGARLMTRVVAILLLLAASASAQEVRVMTSGGMTAAYLEVLPQFERGSQLKVLTAFGASMGGAPDSIPVRLDRGEPVDVVILASTALDNLIETGRVVPGSRVDLVRSTIGMAVRKGAPKPDISTVEKLKQVLLAAKSVAYSASASGTYIGAEMFQNLGIAEQMKGKSQRIVSERVGTIVARGDAELGFQQVSELMPIEGIDYVGPLPGEVQRVTVFSAGLATGATNVEGAKALIRFLASPAAVPAITKSGLEPLAAAARPTAGR